MINYDSHRGVNVSIEADNKYSELVISQASGKHSGNYSCVTNNAVPASTIVHILYGKFNCFFIDLSKSLYKDLNN